MPERNRRRARMKKLVVMLAVAMMVAGMRANAYDEYQQPVSPYYTSGVQYLKSHQYTNAITELKKALRENPNDTSARIQLINAYLARAAYFNNQAKAGLYRAPQPDTLF